MTTIDTATPAVDSAGLIGARRQTSAPRPRTVPASLDQHPDLVDVDVVRARQTVPRAAVAGGSRALPAVDLDVWLLHVRYARGRHPAIRAKLVEEYRGYAVGLARRLHREGESLEDLIQVAMEALLLAIDRFDPSRGIPFPALATPTIVGCLKRHYRDHGWSVRVPRWVHDIAAPARDASDRLTAQLGRFPTVREVAAELGIGEAALLAAQEATHARSLASLDAAIGDDGRRSDLVGDADSGMTTAEDRVVLGQAMQHLSERERAILGMYYFEERSQSEIACLYGVSQMQVSRWLSAAIRSLRDRMHS